jgi:hypothetical protein
MRKFWISAATIAASLLAGITAHAAGPACAAPACAAPAPTCAAPSCGAEPACAAAGVAGTGGCCDDGCGRGRGRGPRYEGLDAYFNCGCNGSYKFPVPPLYTYHWPGMYSAQLMTDYHSPWRFPPLKPYVDEVPPVEMGQTGALGSLRTVSHTSAIEARPVGQSQSMSSRMLRSR